MHEIASYVHQENRAMMTRFHSKTNVGKNDVFIYKMLVHVPPQPQQRLGEQQESISEKKKKFRTSGRRKKCCRC